MKGKKDKWAEVNGVFRGLEEEGAKRIITPTTIRDRKHGSWGRTIGKEGERKDSFVTWQYLGGGKTNWAESKPKKFRSPVPSEGMAKRKNRKDRTGEPITGKGG